MFWNRKPKEEEILLPGLCECGHKRCSHEDGKGRCHASYAASSDFPYGGTCACQIYIRDDDDDDDDPIPETPSPSELETLYHR